MTLVSFGRTALMAAIAGAAITGLAACSGGGTNPPAPDPVALVKTAQVAKGDVATTQAVYGNVLQNADTQVTLSAPVEAIVDRIAAPVGSPVSRGSLVISLRPSPATKADMARLASEAQSAQQAYERALRLRDDGLASDADVEIARTAAAGAKASRAAIADEANGLSLRAPSPGFVQSIASNPGDLVSAGTVIATITRNGNLRARLGVAPDMIARLSRGGGVKLAIAGSARTVVVPIAAVDPSVDPQTRLSSVYINVPASLGLAAGQPLHGAITLEQAGGALVVPYAALLDDGGQPYVFVIEKGAAHRVDVTTGAANSDKVAISGGVRAGQQVVVAGGTALEDGMKVRTK